MGRKEVCKKGESRKEGSWRCVKEITLKPFLKGILPYFQSATARRTLEVRQIDSVHVCRTLEVLHRVRMKIKKCGGSTC